jgi:hypothetical protein
MNTADNADSVSGNDSDDASIAPPAVLPPVVPAFNEMEVALTYIGFDTAAICSRLRSEGLTRFSDMKSMKEKDIRNIAESFAKRTLGDGRYLFGIRRTRLLIGMVHWVQDFGRIGETPTVIPFIGDRDGFKAALTIASDWADVRKIEIEQSDTISKAADPGKFKDKRKWPEWEPAFENYLSTIPGVSGVPLSYVIRLQETPSVGQTYESFNEQDCLCPTYRATISS